MPEDMMPRDSGKFLQEQAERDAVNAVHEQKGCAPQFIAGLIAVMVLTVAGAFAYFGLEEDDSDVTLPTTTTTLPSDPVTDLTNLAAGEDDDDVAEEPEGGGDAVCAQYNMHGLWKLETANGIVADVQLYQAGTDLTGTMTLSAQDAHNAGWSQETNNLSGTLVGDRLVFIVDSPHVDGYEAKGEYSGTVTDAGVPSGTSREVGDRGTGGAGATWTIEGRPQCSTPR